MTYTTQYWTPIGQTVQNLMSSLVKASEESSREKVDEREYCKTCSGYEECQYGEGGRGFEAIYSTYEFNGESVEYKAWRKCRYKLAREAEAQVQHLYKESGLPKGTHHLKLKDSTSDKVSQKYAGGVVLGNISDLYIESAREVAIAIGNELIKRHEAVKYVTIAELLTDLKYQDNARYGEKLEQYLRIGVLIIEGLGSERWSEYSEEQVTMVLERRMRAGLRTVISGRNALGREQYSILKEQVGRMVIVKG